MEYLLGLDLGTSAVKATLLPARGGPLYSASEVLTLSTPHPGWSEQNPEDWWSAATAAIVRVLEKSGVDARSILAVAASGQMHGATLLDQAGRVLRPAILWNDTRSGPQCREITETIGLQRLIEWVGNPALAGFTAPKVLWVRAHEPDVYRKTATVLLPKDYLNYRLTGSVATEVSDASGTLLFDVAQRKWSESMLNALELPASLLPAVHESTSVIGSVCAAAASLTGLVEGTPVVAGGADNACAAVGAGVVSPGTVLVSIGTSGTVVSPTEAAVIDPRARLHCFCHAVPDTWYLMGVVLSAGGSLRWYRDVIATEERRRALETGRDAYELITEMAELAPPGSEGLLFLPYLTGERSPHGDPDARGVFFGLSLRHGREHLARSVFEGVTFALADSAALMRELRVEFDAVRATGGGARSTFWRRLLADVLQTRVTTTNADEGPAFGAAILAGTGVGVFSSVTDATDTLVRLGQETTPRPEMAEVYGRYRSVYDALYPALRDSFAQDARLQG